MYVKWAVGKCPAIACRTFLAPRNQRSKSVNSFAGHPVLYTLAIKSITKELRSQESLSVDFSWLHLTNSWLNFLIGFVVISKLSIIIHM